MAEVLTLEFRAGQQRRMLDEMATMRGDVRVLTAIVPRNETMPLRLDETLNGVLEQMRAMVPQNAWLSPSSRLRGEGRGEGRSRF
jgi:hypothetical protein